MSLVFSLIDFVVQGVAILRLLRLVRVILALKKFKDRKKKLQQQLSQQKMDVQSNREKILTLLEEMLDSEFLNRN